MLQSILSIREIQITYLLYAKTDEEICPDHEYRMSGNKIGVKTLDLSGDFDSIRNQLDAIVSRYLDDAA